MQNRRMKRIIFLSLAVILAIPTGVRIVYFKVIEFNPALFLSEYFKILGSIVPVVFGFFLINYYWEHKTEREKTELIRYHLKKDLQEIYDSINDICDLTAETSISKEDVTILGNVINRHRLIIKREYRNIELFAERITHMPDTKLSDATSRFLREVDKSMQLFFTANMRKISPKGEDFQRVIREIKRITREAIRMVGEDNNER